MILDESAFVERVLPGATVRKLTEEEMAVYRAPFPTPASRGLKNCRVVRIGPGIHYLQEDNPQAIGSTIREWLSEICPGEGKTSV